MPYRHDDALNTKAFDILLKRGALETPKKTKLKTFRKKMSISPPNKSKSHKLDKFALKNTVSNNRTRKHNKIKSPKNETLWIEFGRGESVRANALLQFANSNAPEHQKLKIRLKRYENEMAQYLQIIDEFIKTIPEKDMYKNKYLRKESLSPIFKSVNIRGDGNCLFNSLAWWIITYFSTTDVSFGKIDDLLRKIVPRIQNAINPLDVAKSENISQVASMLRLLVCGFYQEYRISGKDLKETDLNLVSLSILNDQIASLESNHRQKICKDGEFGTDVDARIIGYIFKVNLVFIMDAEYSRVHHYVAEYGEIGRPVFYMFNTTRAHYDVLYPVHKLLRSSPSF